ncbi:unnamed protein product [Closterium sp. NIES-54]
MATITVIRQRQPSVQESLSPQQLRKWAIWWGSPGGGASRARRQKPLSPQQRRKWAVRWGATIGGTCGSTPAGSAASRRGGSGGGQQQQQRPLETLSLQQLLPVPVTLADPSGGPVVARGATVLPCPAAPSELLTGLHLPSFAKNSVATSVLQDQWVTVTQPGGKLVAICTDSRTGEHLAMFTRRPGSGLYTLTTESALVSESGQVAAPVEVASSCSYRLLKHQNLLWHHRLGHPSLPRMRGMHSLEGRQRAAPHSSSFPPTTAPLQTLHMDVWGPARVTGHGGERYFLLVVDDYTRYTTVFPLQSKADVRGVLIRWILAVRLQLCARFCEDLLVMRLHSDRSGEFFSQLLEDFCGAEGIVQSYTLPASPQQNGIAERRIGLVMEVARTSMIHAAAPHFLWPFAVRYAAEQLNLWPRVFHPETSPTLWWTGEIGDASAFRVWGSLSLVRDLPAGKLSPRTLRCVFFGFPTDAPPWQFHHPGFRRMLSSRDVTFDESVCFYRLHHYHSSPVALLPLSQVDDPPPVAPLPPPGPAPSGVSLVDPPPLFEPLEVSSDTFGLAEGGDQTAADTMAPRRSARLAVPPGFPPRPSSPPLRPIAVDSSAAGGGDTGGADSVGAGSGGAVSPTGAGGARGAVAGGSMGGGAGGASAGGAGAGGAGAHRQETLLPERLREWAVRWGSPGGGARRTGAAGFGGASPGGARVGVLGGTGTGGTGAARGTGGAGPVGASAVVPLVGVTGGAHTGGATGVPVVELEVLVYGGAVATRAGGFGGATTQPQQSALRRLFSLLPAAIEFPVAMLMMERGLWGFFDGTEKKPDDESGIAAWKKKDQKAFATLISRIGINLVSSVRMCIKLEASAHEAWKRLETIHVNKTLHGKILARNAFYTVKMRAGESMHEYATRVEELGETFMDLGGTVTEEDWILTLLCGLPEEWSTVITTLDSVQDTWTKEMVVGRLLHEESRRRQFANESVETAMYSGGSSGKKSMWSKSATKKSFGGSDRGKRNTSNGSSKCHYCGKAGHFWRECRKRPSDWTPSKARNHEGNAHAASGDADDSRETIVLLAGDETNTPRDAWFLDTGATQHMMHSASFLTNVGAPRDITRVVFGNDKSLPVVGVGSTRLIVDGGPVDITNGDVAKAIQEWALEVCNDDKKRIKVIRTDGGGEFVNNELAKWMKSKGIKHYVTTPYTPQQNGAAKRLNRTLVEAVRSLLQHSKLGSEWWGEASSLAAWIRNCLPTKVLPGTTPFEAWSGTKPNLSRLRTFGCLCYYHVLDPLRHKLQPKARAAIYLGIAANERAWRVWDLSDKRVVTSRDVVFDEDKFPTKEQPTPQLTVVLPAQEDDEAVEVLSQVEKEAENGGGQNEESDDDVVEVPSTEAATSSTPSSLPLALTREQRIRRPNTKYNDYAMVAVGELDEERAAYCFATLGDDPRTHTKALASLDAPLWKQAMEKELASIKENDVFELVDPPKGAYLVGCKWVLKKNLGADGSVERYKARLVTQGYTQREGEHYSETFAPVAKATTLRVLLALAASLDLEVEQLDVCSAFLYGLLMEEVYMRQPPGYDDGSGRVWKLKRTLYGLKQSPRGCRNRCPRFQSDITRGRATHIGTQCSERNIASWYSFSLGAGSVSWSSTRSSSVLRSSCEAEIYAGAMAA